MNRTQYKLRHRAARVGNLGTLAMMLCAHPFEYQWFLREVYDLRFPHIGDSRHNVRRSFDVLGGPMRVKPWHVVFHASHYRPVKVGPAVNLP